MMNKCKVEPGVAIGTEGLGDAVDPKEVKDEQECARLASNKTVGLFWTFDTNQKICHMKKTDGQKRPLEGWVTGNRECGLLDQNQWEQLVKEEIILSPEIRNGLKSYLTSVNCQETESTGKEQLPIIDLFLNPNRSKELKETLQESEKREGSVTHTKVTSNPFDSLD